LFFNSVHVIGHSFCISGQNFTISRPLLPATYFVWYLQVISIWFSCFSPKMHLKFACVTLDIT
jgi:hypothetical protein